MSYDLMVFDPDAAPKTRADFMKWYKQQTRWSENHSYKDPAVTTAQVRAWFEDMIKEFPAMNGPFASKDDDARLADYCIGRSVIYTTFSWSDADDAYQSVFQWAKRHMIGFFDVSSNDGRVWMPNSDGDFVHVHGG
ncbi:MAG TPA: hypothetical protein P5307_25140 [Pirellulaceae bacterium]|nr:hypothetical protein [Pirellulaceae bacterium]